MESPVRQLPCCAGNWIGMGQVLGGGRGTWEDVFGRIHLGAARRVGRLGLDPDPFWRLPKGRMEALNWVVYRYARCAYVHACSRSAPAIGTRRCY